MFGVADGLPLGELIRRARGRRRWSQQDLADRLSVNRKTVDNWENGRTAPSGATRAAIEDVFGDDLYGEPEPITPRNSFEERLAQAGLSRGVFEELVLLHRELLGADKRAG